MKTIFNLIAFAGWFVVTMIALAYLACMEARQARIDELNGEGEA